MKFLNIGGLENSNRTTMDHLNGLCLINRKKVKRVLRNRTKPNLYKENKMGFLATIPKKYEFRFNDGIPEQ